MARRWPGLVLGALAGCLARDLDLPTVVSYWGDRTPLVLICAALGALLWTPRLQPAVKWTTAALAALWLTVIATPLAGWMAGGLVRHDPEAAADAVFVFGSGLQLDGDLNHTSMARLVHALELIGAGRSRRLVLSELPPPYPSYATAARPLLARLGLEAEVFSVGPVRDSRDEALAVAALARRQGWSRLLAVTSPLHSRRACAALEHAGVAVLSSPAVEVRYDLERLDRPGDRLQAFSAALHERLGLWLYARRGWIR